MSVVFARKYRPKQLDQLVGQATVVKTLSNAIKKGNLHHAYLFVGQFGSGKTTVARILAAMENCEVSPGLHPCGTCPACEQIFEGKHTDVKEIDAASEAGSVDQIRELKKEALYNPVDGATTKYFIVDECLPANAVITVDGKQTTIGDVVESHIPDEIRSVSGRDMETGKTIDREIIRYIKIPNDKQMYEIDIKDEHGITRTLRITGNHNIFVEGIGKVRSEDLSVGQKVFLET